MQTQTQRLNTVKSGKVKVKAAESKRKLLQMVQKSIHMWHTFGKMASIEIETGQSGM